ncbi:DEAD/DEAH box helicase [Geodermatophilus obscurus]|uniref:Type III restriction protein res subunit n=1 Tax=Geodermatophilus obscurus (strain ATCC 25078 / DSM 43160 / JCM 3152 / CCUG 61914 / KCC A-0152 / KCTC 9177 / NBRC 13315 / NRRL B-3577 / G-20) TaxID=526225 RepID=D2S8D8_GEOOG|nr:DEAD/DEAH box helicase family protein [Geodermatophilus obscurus]ADB73560.1 type III restriction protein res subunit [Geodermatophilus obscurus DSM 43160]
MASAARAEAVAPQRTSRPLRVWQQAALEKYEQESPKDFLVTATPGAGKTTFALTLAFRLLQRREVARVVVVCPTDHLRLQWADAADRMGIVLDPGLTNAVGPVRAGTQGYVTTYAQVAGKPMLHAARSTAVKTLVILDEVHHAGDGLSWGEAVEEAYGFAARRLCLTGTPFRTKPDERIPFVRYEEDGFEGDDGEGGMGLVSRADYTYGYKEALADNVVRPVVFAAYTGTSRWRNSAGEVVAASLSEAGTRSVEMQAWRTALDPKGQWVPHVIAAMDDRITHLREDGGMPDAAGLILASDQDDARAYAKIVRRVTGKAPELILSDDPKASKRIERFANGSARIAVCVRMISEGVDVPRAAVLAWMTSYRTPLFFAQAVGRVVRARASHESATVFLPAVRPLLGLAASMEEQRNHVMPPPKTVQGDELDLEPLPPKEREPVTMKQFQALEADARFAHVLASGTAHTGEGRPAAEPLAAEEDDFLGIPGLLTAEQTASLLAKRDDELRIRIAQRAHSDDDTGELPIVEDHPDEDDAGRSWRDAAELRREVNRLVARVAAKTSRPHGVVHTELRKAVPGPPSASASVDVLRARRERLRTML